MLCKNDCPRQTHSFYLFVSCWWFLVSVFWLLCEFSPPSLSPTCLCFPIIPSKIWHLISFPFSSSTLHFVSLPLVFPSHPHLFVPLYSVSIEPPLSHPSVLLCLRNYSISPLITSLCFSLAPPFTNTRVSHCFTLTFLFLSLCRTRFWEEAKVGRNLSGVEQVGINVTSASSSPCSGFPQITCFLKCWYFQNPIYFLCIKASEQWATSCWFLSGNGSPSAHPTHFYMIMVLHLSSDSDLLHTLQSWFYRPTCA